MMMKIFVVFIISTLALSCQHIEKPEKPVDLIEKTTLVDILVDTYLSNAIRSKTYHEIKNDNIRLEKYIYQKYEIDSLQFAKSNAYYTADLDEYLKILQEVEQKLLALKKEEDSVEVDTIKNLKTKADKNVDPEEDDF